MSVNTELIDIMNSEGRLIQWAETVSYDAPKLTAEDNEISEVVDNWVKDIGKTGHDGDHAISQMITKAISPEVINAPSVLIDNMFTSTSIGEFDDYRTEIAPKNTLQVHEATPGGNVDRSFIDFKVGKPEWTNLQVETDLSFQEMRRGGYKSVSTLINFINEALENKKIAKITEAMDALIVSNAANYIAEGTASPSEASMDALSLYLHDVMDSGTPVSFALNKYIQKIAKLPNADKFFTDTEKSLYNKTGFLNMYAGVELYGLSGQKKLGDGSFLIPDKRVYGVAGVIGEVISRGETQTYQESDINSEKLHIKVAGYTFGYVINDVTKIAKIVMAS